ncbi:MAG: hypothetical protein V1495_06880 [Pseudomonadota bacterium]
MKKTKTSESARNPAGRLFALTRYQDKVIADLVQAKAEKEGLSVASLQKKLMYEALHKDTDLSKAFQGALSEEMKKKGGRGGILQRLRNLRKKSSG